MDMRTRIMAVIAANKDFTVRGISLAAGMSDSMLNKFLKGNTESMTIKNAENLADALGVDLVWLMRGEGDSSRATDIALKIERLSAEHKALVEQLVVQFGRTGTDG